MLTSLFFIVPATKRGVKLTIQWLIFNHFPAGKLGLQALIAAN
jgi:hypothetical protein